MKLDALIGRFSDARRSFWIISVLAGLLGVSNLLVLMELSDKERVVVLIPPHLAGESEIESSRASEDYMKAWGHHIAMTIANVTPGTVRMARSTLEPLLAPGAYHDAIARLETEIDQVERDRVTSTFEPRRVGVSMDRGLVWIEGYQVVKSIGEGETRSTVTFEVFMSMDNYRPLITDIKSYEGVARGDG